jgi:uncharacterized protein (TIGR03437 family)
VVQPTSLPFDNVFEGASQSQQFCITANSLATFNVTSSDQNDFHIVTGQSTTGMIGEYELVTVGFTPKSTGMISAVVEVTSGLQIMSVRVSGTGVAPTPLANCTPSFPVGIVGRGYQQPLCASGGSTVYSWQIASGSLPPGMQLSGNMISGMPSQTGAYPFTVLLQDTFSPPNALVLSFVIVVTTPLSICTDVLPPASPGVVYSQQVCVSGGVAPYSTFQLVAGTLPPGLSLGYFSILGTPSQPGAYTFSLYVKDSSTPPQSVTWTTTVLVYPPLVITTTTLPDGSVGTNYQQSLAASGGDSMYKWSLSSGTLPPGLSLTGNVISGTPTTAGRFTFGITVSDTAAQPQTAKDSFTVNISQVPTIASVQDAESALKTVVPGEWIAIYGSNLAGTTRIWGDSDFANGNGLPVSLDGVSVQFDGKAAAVYYVSPGQVDVQAPSSITGFTTVTLTYNGFKSNGMVVPVVQYAPSLFNYSGGSVVYAASTHADGTPVGHSSVLGPPATESRPGETIVLYVNGLAPSVSGTIITTPLPYVSPVSVTVGGENAMVVYAGLVAAGQYQVNITLPNELATGDLLIRIQTQGPSSPAGVYLPVAH